MRRQTAQFWAYLSMLTASVLGLAGVSYVLPSSTSYEYAAGALFPLEPVTKPEPTTLKILVPDPNADKQAAVRARNDREVVERWYLIAAGNEERARQVAAEEKAAEAAARAAVKPKPRPVVHVQTSATPQPVGACDGWLNLVGQYSWDVGHACRILHCESKGNPNAYNRSSASGLFQILGGPFDPAANVALAFQMYSQRGWQPWVCKG